MKRPNPKGSRASNMKDYRISNARDVNKKRFPNGCLYIIHLEGTDYYKIGVSQNPERRIRDLQSATPFNIISLYCEYYRGVYEIEECIHELIKENYVKSEWFKLEFEQVYDLLKKISEDKTIKLSNQSKQLNLL